MSRYAHDPSASKHLTGFILFVIGVALTVGLFYVKTRAQSAQQHVEMIENSIEKEKAAIAVLRAEIAYRQSPERLAALSRQQLGLGPIKTEATVKSEDIPKLIPLRDKPASEGGVRDE
jgi:cell division protein FtsL